ncbi:hypothetical protein HDU67_009712 [Dinochytrium kinnereticum]|nr:hypothetical protein HDU67_009712 [Dinochytrium kinnereticum]
MTQPLDLPDESMQDDSMSSFLVEEMEKARKRVLARKAAAAAAAAGSRPPLQSSLSLPTHLSDGDILPADLMDTGLLGSSSMDGNLSGVDAGDWIATQPMVRAAGLPHPAEVEKPSRTPSQQVVITAEGSASQPRHSFAPEALRSPRASTIGVQGRLEERRGLKLTLEREGERHASVNARRDSVEFRGGSENRRAMHTSPAFERRRGSSDGRGAMARSGSPIVMPVDRPSLFGGSGRGRTGNVDQRSRTSSQSPLRRQQPREGVASSSAFSSPPPSPRPANAETPLRTPLRTTPASSSSFHTRSTRSLTTSLSAPPSPVARRWQDQLRTSDPSALPRRSIRSPAPTSSHHHRFQPRRIHSRSNPSTFFASEDTDDDSPSLHSSSASASSSSFACSSASSVSEEGGVTSSSIESPPPPYSPPTPAPRTLVPQSRKNESRGLEWDGTDERYHGTPFLDALPDSREDGEGRRKAGREGARRADTMDVEELQRLWDAHAAIANDLLRSLAMDAEGEASGVSSSTSISSVSSAVVENEEDVWNAEGKVGLLSEEPCPFETEEESGKAFEEDDDEDGASVYRDARETNNATPTSNRHSVLSAFSSPPEPRDGDDAQAVITDATDEDEEDDRPHLHHIQREPIVSPIAADDDDHLVESGPMLGDAFDFDIEFDFGRRFSRILGFAKAAGQGLAASASSASLVSLGRVPPSAADLDDSPFSTDVEESEGGGRRAKRVTLLEEEIRGLREAVKMLMDARGDVKRTVEVGVDAFVPPSTPLPAAVIVEEPEPSAAPPPAPPPPPPLVVVEQVSDRRVREKKQKRRREKRGVGEERERRREERWGYGGRGMRVMEYAEIEALEEEARMGRRWIGGVRGWNAAPLP